MNSRLCLIFLFLQISGLIVGQEYTTGLHFNEAVKMEAERLELEDKDTRSLSKERAEKILLPFFDDFTSSNIFPNQKLWDGYSVFVNKDFPFMPINTGSATLDAIDSTGSVYSDASWIPFMADELRTQYIRLDSIFNPVPRQLSPADSVYLSFFYQPQGVGDAPQLNDSLLLEFSRETGQIIFSHVDSVQVPAEIYLQSSSDTIWPLDTLWAPLGCNPEVFTINYKIIVWGDIIDVACDSIFVPEIIWDPIWYSEGETLDEFREVWGQNMKQISVPILDSAYYNDKFRFRFRNYASVSNNNYPPSWKSNGDQWNIDYVYLNYNRSISDTTYRVLTFSQRAPSFLKDYEVMPYSQYRYSPLTNTKPELKMYISNLDDIEHNTQYSYEVSQVNGNFGFQYDGGSCNLKPFYEIGFQECIGCGAAHSCPPVNSLFSLDYDRDTTSYIIKHFISDSSDQNSIVDSIIYRQGFYNYYAYDDGTPELGWGVDGAGGAMVAYQFSLNMPDTLQGVQIYFNKTLNDVNEFYFDLLVWNDNNGRPGEIIHRMEGQKVSWEEGLYSFYPYLLEEPLMLSGTIYVGWEKQQKDNMNVGMDANNDRHNRIFYKTDIDWQTSNVSGALLIRPIIGTNIILSTHDHLSPIKNSKLIIFPNPTSDVFTIGNYELSVDNDVELTIYNIFGQLVYSENGKVNQIDVSCLVNGIYIVKAKSNNKYYSAKLLVN